MIINVSIPLLTNFKNCKLTSLTTSMRIDWFSKLSSACAAVKKYCKVVENQSNVENKCLLPHNYLYLYKNRKHM